MPFNIDVSTCESIIGYHFKKADRLVHALTHSSIKSQEHPSNERLEFLGDAILGLEISRIIFHAFPQYNEGQLTKIKSVVVSRAVLAKVCEDMGLSPHIIVGKGFKKNQYPTSIYANIFEAIIAAIYLDGGIRPIRVFIKRTLSAEISAVEQNTHTKNYKSKLQHMAQKILKLTPVYKIIKEEGPDHNKVFEVQAIIGNVHFSTGIGNNKKEAEQNAAANTLAQITINPTLLSATHY